MALADHGVKIGLAIMVTAAVLGGYHLFNGSSSGADSSNVAQAKSVEIDFPTKVEAWAICKKFVDDRLISPSTAEYAGFSDSTIHALGGNNFDVISYVDSQNKFGAQVRERYLCKVHYKGQRTWSLIRLHFK